MTQTDAERREKARLAQAAWRAANPAKKRATEIRYRERHRERIHGQQRAWRLRKGKEYHADKARRWRRDKPAKVAFINYKSAARAKGQEFLLVRGLFDDLVADSCAYCGAAPNPTNGIDRVDNSRGYAPDNVVTCCDMCNKAKRNLPIADFVAWGERLSTKIHLWRAVL